MYSKLKHAYREDFTISSESPSTSDIPATTSIPSSNPTYTLTQYSFDYKFTSSTNSLETVFTSSTDDSTTININSGINASIGSNINTVSFKVYNYSSSTITYKINVNNTVNSYKVVCVNCTRTTIPANSYDIWTFDGSVFSKTSNNKI